MVCFAFPEHMDSWVQHDGVLRNQSVLPAYNMFIDRTDGLVSVLGSVSFSSSMTMLSIMLTYFT